MDTLDDAAAAALWRLRHQPKEEIGLLYEGGEGIKRTETQGTGDQRRTGGAFKIPAGSLRALFHNHPERDNARDARSISKDEERVAFSADDKSQARKSKVPSYISAGERIFRYDPKTGKTEEVLAQIPAEAIPPRMMTEAAAKASESRIDAAREARIREYTSGTMADTPPKQ